MPVKEGGKGKIYFLKYRNRSFNDERAFFSQQEIIQELKDMQQEVKAIEAQPPLGNQYDIMVNVLDSSLGWKGGRWFGANDAPLLWDAQNYYDVPDGSNVGLGDSFKYFQIMIKQTQKGAGADKYNNCFVHALQSFAMSCHESQLKKKVHKVAYRWKAQFGLAKDEPVPYELLPKIEQHYGIGISVSGDHEREPCADAVEKNWPILTVRWVAGHVTRHDGRNSTMKNTSFKGFSNNDLPYWQSGDQDHSLVVYNSTKVYGGVAVQPLNTSQYSSLLWQKTKSDKVMWKVDDDADLEASYDKLHEVAEQLQKASQRAAKGYKNYNAAEPTEAHMYMHKSSGVRLLRSNSFNVSSPKLMAKNMFFKWFLSKHPQLLDPIQDKEAKWIQEAGHGGLQWAQAGEYDFAVGYDANAFYPSVMSKGKHPQWHEFPVKKGEFKKYDGKPFLELGTPMYGIYRCAVHNGNCKQCKSNGRLCNACRQQYKKMVWLKAGYQYYTHLDLKAIWYINNEMEGHHNLVIKLVPDADGHDSLVYDRTTRFRGAYMFGKYFEYLDRIADNCESKLPLLKLLRNCLWGALCEKSTRKIDMSVPDKCINLHEDRILGLCGHDPESNTYEVQKISKPFKTNFARIGPFVQAYGRYGMFDLLKDNYDSMLQIHTDGFILDCFMNQRLLTHGMGAFKKEVVDKKTGNKKQGPCVIKHVNDVRFV